MKKFLTACLLALVLFIPLLAQAQALTPETEKALDETVSKLKKAFPPVELYVIALQEGKFILENIKGSELHPGLELSVFREGKEFTHPITGVTLGRFEETLGNLRLIEVKATYCLAELVQLKPGKEIKRGDKVRITADKIKLALWGEEALAQQLAYKLENSERFEVTSPSEFALALDKLSIDKNTKTFNKQQLQQLAKTLGIRGVTTTQTKQSGGVNWLESKLFSTVSGATLAKTKARLQVSTPAPTPAPIQPTRTSTSPIQNPNIIKHPGLDQRTASSGFIVKKQVLPKLDEGVFKSESLAFAIRAMSCGDVNGDGKKEIVVTDGNQIHIFAFEKQKLVSIWEEKGDGHNHLSLEVIDVNQNGKAEIFITEYLDSTGLHAYALEYDGKDYSQVAEWKRYFLRSLPPNTSHDKYRLTGQKMGRNDVFYGEVEVLSWKDGSYVVQESLKLPDGVDIYGFIQDDVNADGQVETIYIDDHDRLNVYSPDGETLWKSSDHYGGYELFFHHRPASVISTVPGYMPGNKVKIKGRIFVHDMNKNGVTDILIVHNIPASGYLFPNAPAYTKGYIANLEWDRIGYNKTWETKQLDAYISDFLLEDLDNDGKQELIMGLVIPKGWDDLLQKRRSLILFYSL